MQTTQGTYTLTLRGVPFLMLGRLKLVSDGGGKAGGWGLIVFGLLIGVVTPR